MYVHCLKNRYKKYKFAMDRRGGYMSTCQLILFKAKSKFQSTLKFKTFSSSEEDMHRVYIVYIYVYAYLHNCI